MINPDTGQALVEFPCDFLFKITGKNDAQFESSIIKLLQQVDVNLNTSRIKRTLSKTTKYLSLSVYVHVTAQAQIDQVYQLLKNEAQVLWAL